MLKAKNLTRAAARRPPGAALSARLSSSSSTANAAAELRQQKYQRDWDERTRAHREKTQEAAREARFTAVATALKVGAIGAGLVTVLLSMWYDSRRRKAMKTDTNLPPTGAKEAPKLPAGLLTAFAAAERERSTEGSQEERNARRVAEMVQLAQDEREEGVPHERRALLQLGDRLGDSYAAMYWKEHDAHKYTSKPELVADVKVRTEGKGLKVQADDFVHLHFSDPELPNSVYRETVKLDRDDITPALRDAIVGQPSNTVLSFNLKCRDDKGEPWCPERHVCRPPPPDSLPRIVHVQSHGDLLKEMVEDVEEQQKRAQIIEGLRSRAF